MNNNPSTLEVLLRRDRWVVTAALLVVCIGAWIYTLTGAGMGMSAWQMTSLPWNFESPSMDMPSMDPSSTEQSSMDMSSADMSSMNMSSLQGPNFLVLLAMWWIMMIAMMLPSAAPTILLAAALNRRSNAGQAPFGSAASFTIGYLFSWLAFSAGAVAMQQAMERYQLISAMMASASVQLTAGLLIAAGIWQFTSLKSICLRHCRSPMHYLVQNRRPGNWGGFVTGVSHGTYCLGCCWVLMLLLFVGGVMNVFWIGGLALIVLVEKWLPWGVWVARVVGFALVGSGLAVLLGTIGI